MSLSTIHVTRWRRGTAIKPFPLNYSKDALTIRCRELYSFILSANTNNLITILLNLPQFPMHNRQTVVIISAYSISGFVCEFAKSKRPSSAFLHCTLADHFLISNLQLMQQQILLNEFTILSDYYSHVFAFLEPYLKWPIRQLITPGDVYLRWVMFPYANWQTRETLQLFASVVICRPHSTHSAFTASAQTLSSIEPCLGSVLWAGQLCLLLPGYLQAFITASSKKQLC